METRSLDDTQEFEPVRIKQPRFSLAMRTLLHLLAITTLIMFLFDLTGMQKLALLVSVPIQALLAKLMQRPFNWLCKRWFGMMDQSETDLDPDYQQRRLYAPAWVRRNIFQKLRVSPDTVRWLFYFAGATLASAACLLLIAEFLAPRLFQLATWPFVAAWRGVSSFAVEAWQNIGRPASAAAGAAAGSWVLWRLRRPLAAALGSAARKRQQQLERIKIERDREIERLRAEVQTARQDGRLSAEKLTDLEALLKDWRKENQARTNSQDQAIQLLQQQLREAVAASSVPAPRPQVVGGTKRIDSVDDIVEMFLAGPPRLRAVNSTAQTAPPAPPRQTPTRPPEVAPKPPNEPPLHATNSQRAAQSDGKRTKPSKVVRLGKQYWKATRHERSRWDNIALLAVVCVLGSPLLLVGWRVANLAHDIAAERDLDGEVMPAEVVDYLPEAWERNSSINAAYKKIRAGNFSPEDINAAFLTDEDVEDRRELLSDPAGFWQHHCIVPEFWDHLEVPAEKRLHKTCS